MNLKSLLTHAIAIAVVVVVILMRDPEPSEPEVGDGGAVEESTPAGNAPEAGPDRKTGNRPSNDGTTIDPDAPAKAVKGLLAGELHLFRQALKSDPRNPHLLYLGATHAGLPVEERLELSERFYEASPNNALAAYVHAALLMGSGDLEAATGALNDAARRSQMTDYLDLTIPLMDEAYTSVGTYTPLEVKVLGFDNLKRPYLTELGQLATALRDQSESLPEPEGAQLRSLAATMAARLATHTESALIPDREAALSLARETLEGFPENAPSPFPDLTVKQARTALAEDLAELRTLKEMRLNTDDIFSLEPEVTEGYIERLRSDGEVEALRWLQDKAAASGAGGI